tara:strand:+ start:2654 stop:3160 length:507 start_codon:yes stop_codon:yes gene_type:complete
MIIVSLAIIAIAVPSVAGEFEEGAFWAASIMQERLPDEMQPACRPTDIVLRATRARGTHELDLAKLEVEKQKILEHVRKSRPTEEELVEQQKLRIRAAEAQAENAVQKAERLVALHEDIAKLRKDLYALRLLLIHGGMVDAGVSPDYIIKKYGKRYDPKRDLDIHPSN